MKNFRQYARGAAVALVCAVALTACSSADGGTGDGGSVENDGRQLIKQGQITIAMSGEFKPFSHFDEANKLTGFDYDIAAAIAGSILLPDPGTHVQAVRRTHRVDDAHGEA